MAYKYKCVEAFEIPELEDFEGNESGKNFKIENGDIWEKETPVLDTDKEVVLTKGKSWIDIHRDLFDLMFEPFHE